jgi:hypothetical protein
VCAATASIVLGVAGTAHAAVMRSSYSGSEGSVGYSAGAGTSQGKVTNNAASGYCAEFWWDWRTEPHRHIDAYAVRRCDRGTGQGQVHTVSTSNLSGMRVAACVYRMHNGIRSCNQSWVHDSVGAGTFHMQEV